MLDRHDGKSLAATSGQSGSPRPKKAVQNHVSATSVLDESDSEGSGEENGRDLSLHTSKVSVPQLHGDPYETSAIVDVKKRLWSEHYPQYGSLLAVAKEEIAEKLYFSPDVCCICASNSKRGRFRGW